MAFVRQIRKIQYKKKTNQFLDFHYAANNKKTTAATAKDVKIETKSDVWMANAYIYFSRKKTQAKRKPIKK